MNKRIRALRRIEADKSEKAKQFAKQPRYEDVFTVPNFVRSYKKSICGVSWKFSVQNYTLNCAVKMFDDYCKLKERKLPRHITRYNITLYERGKKRIILPVHVKDRIIQKVLCDNVLVDELSKHLIYDNGASTKCKGTSFSRNRMDKFMRMAIKEYGSNFYVLSFDFKDFFNSIPHKTCRTILNRYISDKDIVNASMEIIKTQAKVEIEKIKSKRDRSIAMELLKADKLSGISLGSQVSQIMALIVPNEIDHYIKDRARMKYYIRHMDDGIVLAKTKEELKSLLDGINSICSKLGLILSEKKTYITKASRGFTFLKVKYHVSERKLVKRLTRKGIVRMRRKLKKFKNSNVSLSDVNASLQSWLEHSKVAKSNRTRRKMLRLYRNLFERGGGNGTAVLQDNCKSKYRWSYYTGQFQEVPEKA